MNSINFLCLLVLCLFSLLNFCNSSENTFKEIEINDGVIKGVKKTTIIDKKIYYAFRGIPFAKPPTGNRRFMVPEVPEPWNKKVLDTFKYRSYCPQIPNFGFEKGLVGDEDCLYLNVYTPDLTPKSKLTVMVNIHGGGFAEGNGDDLLYGPDFLIDENVIYVAINYRLGVLGFLSMGTDEYSGNMGMKDQVMALQWVYDNIQHFGGDNNQITIFGESAGGCAVHLHTLSPMSKNLFNRAIMQSGSALNAWSYQYNTNHQDVLFNFAKQNGKNIKNVDKLMEYLTEVDVTELVSAFPLKFEKDVNILFGPVIESTSAKSAFITDRPEFILNRQEQKKCDTMFGFTANEYMLFMAKELHDPSSFKEFNNYLPLLIPRREFQFDFNSKEFKMLLTDIKSFYFGEGIEISNETANELIDLYSDLFFVYGIDWSAKLHALDKNSKTYYYRFSVDADLNAAKKMFGRLDFPGTSHADEICYLYSCKFYLNNYKKLKEDSVELQSIKRINKLWTNFAKFGNPTPNKLEVNWKPIKHSKIHFADIQNDGLHVAEEPQGKQIKFWNDLFKKYSHLLSDEHRKNFKEEL